MTRPPDAGDKTFGEVAARAVDSFSDLVQVHIALAKAELARDASRLAHDILPLAAAVPLLMTSYLLLSLALAAVLTTWMSTAAGLGAAGLGNLVLGVIAVGASFWRLGRPPLLIETLEADLVRSAQTILPPGPPTAP
jgi:uncharacterized membrane protein YqjE